MSDFNVHQWPCLFKNHSARSCKSEHAHRLFGFSVTSRWKFRMRFSRVEYAIFILDLVCRFRQGDPEGISPFRQTFCANIHDSSQLLFAVSKWSFTDTTYSKSCLTNMAFPRVGLRSDHGAVQSKIIPHTSFILKSRGEEAPHKSWLISPLPPPPIYQSRQKRSSQHVSTLVQRKHVIRWMLSEVKGCANELTPESRIAATAVFHFPRVFRGTSNDSRMKAHRWWANWDELLSTNDPTAALPEVGLTRIAEKALRLIRRNCAPWVEYLQAVLFADLERFQELAVII